MDRTPVSNRSRLLVALWVIVALEIVSPIPAVLSLGTIYVLLFRPPWLPGLVRTLYEEPPGETP